MGLMQAAEHQQAGYAGQCLFNLQHTMHINVQSQGFFLKLWLWGSQRCKDSAGSALESEQAQAAQHQQAGSASPIFAAHCRWRCTYCRLSSYI